MLKHRCQSFDSCETRPTFYSSTAVPIWRCAVQIISGWFSKVWQLDSNDNTTFSCPVTGEPRASELYLRQAPFHREVHPVLSVIHRGGGLRGWASVPRVPVTDVTGGHRGVSVANGNIMVDLLLLLLLLLVVLILCWRILKADSS